MLGDEYRVIAHRCLAAVVFRLGRRQTLGNERLSMFEHGIEPTFLQVIRFSCPQLEAAAKARPRKAGEQVIGITHVFREALHNLSRFEF